MNILVMKMILRNISENQVNSFQDSRFNKNVCLQLKLNLKINSTEQIYVKDGMNMFNIFFCSTLETRLGIYWRILLLIPVTKVFRQNVRSFSGHLNVSNASQKQVVSVRILCSFRIWTLKWCVCFCSRVVRKSLKGLRK
jgi:hypothetical protein